MFTKHIDILIPTCKSKDEIFPQLEEMNKNTPEIHSIFTTYMNWSAAKNRNYAHRNATSPYVIMVDDDILGFFRGWATVLIEPLVNNPDIRFCSARLMKLD